jgi:hypothetical protein
LKKSPSEEKPAGVLGSGYAQRVLVALDPGVFELLIWSRH